MAETKTTAIPDTGFVPVDAPIYPLPDGTEYIPRKIGGHENDVEAIRWLIMHGFHVLLLGEPGCGKTALIHGAFGNRVENEVGHSKMQAPDMLWRWRIGEDGKPVPDPAPLSRAAQFGHLFYLDETMRLSEDGFTPLFSAMDGRDRIVAGNLDQTDMMIQPGFGVVGASNPMVRGAFLPDAIQSRFHILTVETHEDVLRSMGIADELITIWLNLKNQQGGESWKPSIRELKQANRLMQLGNESEAAYAITGHRVPAKDRENVSSVVSSVLGVRLEPSGMGGVIR